MKAAVQDRYGPPDVVRLKTRPAPRPAAGEVLVDVHATTVTTADWRQRASAFPGGLWLAGRLMTGLFSPRHQTLGSEFAGKVAETGTGVTAFRPGDPVFGFIPHGAHAEQLTIKANAAIAPIPGGLSFPEAASLPFGGISALVFLRDVAELKPGQSVLIIGASGNVGAYAVQIAKALGAQVTGVASAANLGFVRDLGADAVIDYHTTDPVGARGRYDVIFDTVGATRFAKAAPALTEQGRFVPLNFSVADALRGLLTRIRPGKTMRIAVSGDSRADLDALSTMIAAGKIHPVVGDILPFAQIREAHTLVETRHRRGSTVLSIIEDQTPHRATRAS